MSEQRLDQLINNRVCGSLATPKQGAKGTNVHTLTLGTLQFPTKAPKGAVKPQAEKLLSKIRIRRKQD